jgi:hypothetical protein
LHNIRYREIVFLFFLVPDNADIDVLKHLNYRLIAHGVPVGFNDANLQKLSANSNNFADNKTYYSITLSIYLTNSSIHPIH